MFGHICELSTNRDAAYPHYAKKSVYSPVRWARLPSVSFFDLYSRIGYPKQAIADLWEARFYMNMNLCTAVVLAITIYLLWL